MTGVSTADLEKVATTIQSVPDVLEALLTPLDPAVLATRPEPGEWSPLEVIGHLIDCDSSAFRDRIGGIIDGVPVIAPFDEWAAINERDFNADSLGQLLGELRAERARSVEFLLGLAPEDLHRSSTFGDGRVFEANDFVQEWSFHDQDHIQQILEATKTTYLPRMTQTMQDALTR